MRLERVRAADVRPLRHDVLRAHDIHHAVDLPGDDDARTAHFAFLDHEGRAVACATVMPEGAPGEWRVRAVATTPHVRKRGYGKRLIAACVEHAEKSGGRMLWLQTSPDLVPWYTKQGFRLDGNVYAVPGGMRQKLVRAL